MTDRNTNDLNAKQSDEESDDQMTVKVEREVEADFFKVKIELHETIDCDGEPEWLDLQLTIRGDDEREIVIVGMDEELQRLVQAIQESLAAKQENEDRVMRRLRLPHKTFRLSGDEANAAASYCLASGPATELDDGSIEVDLPDDAKTIELLNWLEDAYWVVWEPVGSTRDDSMKQEDANG